MSFPVLQNNNQFWTRLSLEINSFLLSIEFLRPFKMQIFNILFVILLFLVSRACSILVGTLFNVSYKSNSSIPVTFNGTCQECLCQAFLLNSSSSYVALNCYYNENKCTLFHNYSISFQLVSNISSRFYFYPNLPPFTILVSVMFDIIIHINDVVTEKNE